MSVFEDVLLGPWGSIVAGVLVLALELGVTARIQRKARASSAGLAAPREVVAGNSGGIDAEGSVVTTQEVNGSAGASVSTTVDNSTITIINNTVQERQGQAADTPPGPAIILASVAGIVGAGTFAAWPGAYHLAAHVASGMLVGTSLWSLVYIRPIAASAISNGRAWRWKAVGVLGAAGSVVSTAALYGSGTAQGVGVLELLDATRSLKVIPAISRIWVMGGAEALMLLAFKAVGTAFLVWLSLLLSRDLVGVGAAARGATIQARHFASITKKLFPKGRPRVGMVAIGYALTWVLTSGGAVSGYRATVDGRLAAWIESASRGVEDFLGA